MSEKHVFSFISSKYSIDVIFRTDVIFNIDAKNDINAIFSINVRTGYMKLGLLVQKQKGHRLS